jgi:rare lipoprotein A
MKKINTLPFIFFIIFATSLLSGCAHQHRTHKPHAFNSDGPPPHDVNAEMIPDAVPRPEARSKYGNKPYKVFGKPYRVLSTAEGYDKHGMVSWYGRKFHGKPTSSRELFDMYALTAASRDLPIPCYARVTNLKNGRQIVVKVNDRGPFSTTDPHRIMDLSYAAAKKLGYANQGTIWVRVTALHPVTGKPWVKENARFKNKSYQPAHLAAVPSSPYNINNNINSKSYLQVGAFSDRLKAEHIQRKLTQLTKAQVHLKSAYKGNMPIYRVQIGPLVNNDQKRTIQKILKNNGFNT